MNAEFKNLLITAVVIPAVTVVVTVGVTKAVERWGAKLPQWFRRYWDIGVGCFRKWGLPMTFSMSITALLLVLGLAMRPWPSIRSSGAATESGGTITIPLSQDRRGHLVTIDLDGANYNHRLWVAAVHNGYNKPGFAPDIVKIKVNPGTYEEPLVAVNAKGDLIISQIPQITPPVTASYTIIDVGSEVGGTWLR